MKQTLARARLGWVLLSLCLAGPAGAGAAAQPVMRVYGSEGPSFAIREAASAFENKHDVRIEVVSGPTDQWLVQAQGNADLVYASAEYMMSDLIRHRALQVEEASVMPLYLRPSVILVRPANPKGIKDFPDLLKPGLNVMVVSGSGQTGLWEDMAGKKGDVQAVRAFRKNVVLFAANSTEAMKQWKERPSIDAWVTWDTWQRPLHGSVEVVKVSQDYAIFRQCSIALTRRGKAHPLAVKFIEFLTSAEGAAIFGSWEWMVSPPAP